MAYFNNVLEAVGNTPLVKLQHLPSKDCASILVKLESLNPGGSIKTRAALGMIRAAERDGKLRPGSIIVEATSGNQGIGLSLVAAVLGYKTIICMPENMSEERKALVRAYGAELVLTPAGKDIQEAITLARQKANEIRESDPQHVFLASQFDNPANPETHRTTTAQEILSQVGGPIDAFVAGIGTGGTLTGVGEVLKAKFPSIKVVAVEPSNAAILRGGTIGHHIQQGIGDGFIPNILNTGIIDDIVLVNDEDALQTARDLARKEGLLVGVSSGSNVWAALRIGQELGKGKTVVTVLPDTGERYLSMGLY